MAQQFDIHASGDYRPCSVSHLFDTFLLFQEGSLDSRKVEMLINCLETGKNIILVRPGEKTASVYWNINCYNSQRFSDLLNIHVEKCAQSTIAQNELC